MKAPGRLPKGKDRQGALSRAHEALAELGKWEDAFQRSVTQARRWGHRYAVYMRVYRRTGDPRAKASAKRISDNWVHIVDNIYICANNIREKEAESRIWYEMYEQKESP